MKKDRNSNPVALVPILVFLVLYLGTGIIFEYVMKIPMGFYNVPIIVAFMAAILSLTENPFVLGEAPVPLFYGAACQDVNTVGGFANWVQDAEYTTCPHCGKPMKYLAQIQWDTVFDCAEGTLYVEFCPDCHIVSMQHQQT